MAVRLTNQPKTRPEPLFTPMYARSENTAQNTIDGKGNPFFVAYLKMLGAFPVSARPYNARDEVYKSEDAADHAEVRSAALITDGRPLIPAVLIAITNGDLAAVELDKARSGWFDGTVNPITNVPRI